MFMNFKMALNLEVKENLEFQIPIATSQTLGFQV